MPYKDIEKRKAHSRIYGKKNWKKIKEKHSAYMIEYKYGITKSEYDKLLKEQDGACAICRKIEIRKRNGKATALIVDHNHATGKVRGLLCHKCNTILGMAEDNINILANSITYLFKKLI